MKIHVKVKDDKNQIYEGTIELTKSRKQKSQKQTEFQISGPTGIIKELYFQNYFENERTLNEVDKKFKSKKYNFGANAIQIAMERAKFLRRKGKRGSYSYIQKIPPN